MRIALYVIIAIILIYIIIRLIWRRSFCSLLIYLYVKTFNIRFKFKDNKEVINKRIEAKRGKPEEIPKWILKNKSLKEYEYEDIKYYCLNEDAKSNIVIFYVHGGGFIEPLNKIQFRFLKKVVKKTDAKLYLPLYHLIPNHNYKDTYPLIINLYLKIKYENANKKMVMGGDSAGGNIALVICEEVKKVDQPDELILISPATTMKIEEDDDKAIESFEKCILVGHDGAQAIADAWAGDSDPRLSLISPYYGDVSNLRNVTMTLGEYDMAYGMGLEMIKKLEEANVDVKLIIGKGLYHVWPLYPMPEAIKVRKEIVNIIKR